MTAFEYVRPDDVAGAVAMVSGDPRAAYLAGGTNQLDLMLKDAVVDADRLAAVRLPFGLSVPDELGRPLDGFSTASPGPLFSALLTVWLIRPRLTGCPGSCEMPISSPD